MARWKGIVGGAAALASLGVAAAAAPATPGTKPVAKAAYVAATPMETNEQIVADFMMRKERAERAQRAILADLRKELDRRRGEFEDARRRFDEARARYSEIVGPLPKQGVMNPSDPRLPYEFEVRRAGPSPAPDETRPGHLSQQVPPNAPR